MSKQLKTSANEVLEVLDKQWLQKKDIQVIASCGITKAGEYMKAITDISIKRGYKPLKGLVPTDLAIDYFKININYLKKMRN
ncbi:MAG: hypothetical protein IJ068_07475 [Bacilli bacterium]|nr:hypothetical protein [Bacilli bacterium]